jgi:hypothetical protein
VKGDAGSSFVSDGWNVVWPLYLWKGVICNYELRIDLGGERLSKVWSFLCLEWRRWWFEHVQLLCDAPSIVLNIDADVVLDCVNEKMDEIFVLFARKNRGWTTSSRSRRWMFSYIALGLQLLQVYIKCIFLVDILQISKKVLEIPLECNKYGREGRLFGGALDLRILTSIIFILALPASMFVTII